jgi:hypothetical protein
MDVVRMRVAPVMVVAVFSTALNSSPDRPVRQA